MTVAGTQFGFLPDVYRFFGTVVETCKTAFALVKPFVFSMFMKQDVVCRADGDTDSALGTVRRDGEFFVRCRKGFDERTVSSRP